MNKIHTLQVHPQDWIDLTQNYPQSLHWLLQLSQANSIFVNISTLSPPSSTLQGMKMKGPFQIHIAY